MKWKPINGTNYLYWVSEYGDVYRNSFCKMYKKGTCKHKEFKGKMLKVNLAGLGYKTSWVCGEAKYHHRLVAEHFLDTEPNECVNHIDGNKLNNHYTNLKWVTFKQNSEHASKTGLINKSSEKRKKQAPLNAKKGGIKNRKWKDVGKIYEIDYNTQTVVCVHESVYNIDKRASHINTSRNRAIQRLEFGEVKKSGKIKTYFLWEEDYNKFKNKLHDN